MRQTVYMCGPIAEPGKPAAGGFEAANRKTLNLLIATGISVVEVPYPRSSGFRKAVQFVLLFFHLFYLLSRRGRSVTSLHLTPLVKHFLYIEALIAAFAKLLGVRLVVDLRAGTQLYHYKNRSFMYRYLYRTLVSGADVVAYEGAVYSSFLRSLRPQKQTIFFPNFVPDYFIRPIVSRLTASGGPHFVYVGSVNKAKGALRTLQAYLVVKENFPQATLSFVGRVSHDCERNLIANRGADVLLLGPKSEAEIVEILDRSHFFMFLTLWRGEGHSNALTEAMARGCVPVVARHGFNEDVVGETGIIAPNPDASRDIALEIAEVWQHRFNELSDAARSRVVANFTQSRALEILKHIHDL